MLDLILKNPACCVFLGAGASVGTGLPLGDDGAGQIVGLLFERSGRSALWEHLNRADAHSWPRFEVVLSSLAKYDRRAMRAVISAFRLGGISSTHRLLVSMYSAPTLWLTTNFDDQIELALTEAGQPFVAISDRESIPRQCTRRDAHVVVKLHGDALTKDDEWDFGVRIDQILRTFPATAVGALADAVAGRPLLVIGYAARDPDLAPLVQSIASKATSIAWVGYGQPDSAVRNLLLTVSNMEYSSTGAPYALADVTGRVVPSSKASASSWSAAVEHALGTIERVNLTQAAADLCLSRGDGDARRCISDLHESIDQADSKQRIRVLRRSIEARLRDGITADVEPLRQLARDENISISDRIEAYSALGAHLFTTGSLIELERLLLEAAPIVQQGTVFDQVQHLQRLGIARAYQGAERLMEASSDLTRAISWARAEKFPLLEMEGNNHLAVALMRADSAAQAEAILRVTKPSLDEIGDPRRNLVYHLNLAEAIRIQGRYAEAAVINEEALVTARHLNDQEVIGNVAGNLGICRLYSGEVAGAERAFKESEQVASRLGGEMRGNALYNRGWLRLLLGLWAESAALLAEAAKAFRSIGAASRAGGAEALKGWCHVRRGDYPPGSQSSETDGLRALNGMHEERVHYIAAMVELRESFDETVAMSAWADLEKIRLLPLSSSFAASCAIVGMSKLVPESTPALATLIERLRAEP